MHYKTEGNAIEGTDYERLPGEIKFKRGETVVHVDIEQIGDLSAAADKVVKLRLEADPGYTVGTKEPEKVEILAKP